MTTQAFDPPVRLARTRPKTVALIGLFGSGNLGNDGSMEAMLGFLRARRPDLEIWCISVDPDAIARTYGVQTMRINRGFPSPLASRVDRALLRIPSGTLDMVRTMLWARRFDAVIAPGTGLLDDFGTGPLGWPYMLFKWCLAARLLGVEIWFVSVGAGPIPNRASRWLMKAAARMAHYRSYRDQISKEFMERIGFDSRHDPVYPDIAFALRVPPTNRAAADAGTTVGIGVMNYHGWYGWAEGGAAIFETYVAKLTQFVVHLLDHNHDIRLLTGETGDWSAVQRLLAEIVKARPEARARITSEPIASLHDLMHQIAQTDIVVATRFHNIVCALKMGKPSISLGYAQKNDVLMAEMGLGGFCHHVEHFDVAALIEQFCSISARRAEFGDALRVRNELFARQLDEQERHLARTLLGA